MPLPPTGTLQTLGWFVNPGLVMPIPAAIWGMCSVLVPGQAPTTLCPPGPLRCAVVPTLTFQMRKLRLRCAGKVEQGLTAVAWHQRFSEAPASPGKAFPAKCLTADLATGTLCSRLAMLRQKQEAALSNSHSLQKMRGNVVTSLMRGADPEAKQYFNLNCDPRDSHKPSLLKARETGIS